jgi:hypothetical protein
VLLDFVLASREPCHPWVTYEEAANLFGERAAQERANLEVIRGRLLRLAAVLMGTLGVVASVAL